MVTSITSGWVDEVVVEEGGVATFMAAVTMVLKRGSDFVGLERVEAEGRGTKQEVICHVSLHALHDFL